MMARNVWSLVLWLFLVERSDAFVHHGGRVPSLFSLPKQRALCSSKDDENRPLSPAKTFGAEAVPESQRPTNEFLDLQNQPMFGWASLESGSKGLLTRLAAVYSVLFAAV